MSNKVTETMPNKYLINHFLYQLSTLEYKEALFDLPILLNLSLSAFNRIRAYPLDSKSSATSDQLIKIAWYINRHMKCNVDDLLNKEHILSDVKEIFLNQINTI